MTNLQLLLSIGIPTFTITFITLYSNHQMNARLTAIEGRLIAIEADLRQFFQILGRHEGEIGMLKERIK